MQGVLFPGFTLASTLSYFWSTEEKPVLGCRGGRVAKIIDSLVSDAVKKFVMNPEYMRAAWMREVENNMLFGMTTDEMLMRGLDCDSHRLPHFAGAHVYPVFPGAAAM